jgi:hypothetical protein
LPCPKELFSVEEDFTTRQICVTETINLEAEQQKSEVLRRREIGESKEKNHRIRLVAQKRRQKRLNNQRKNKVTTNPN